MRQHINVIHNKIIHTCKECDYQTFYSSVLAQHVATEHEGIRYKCPHCPYEAKRRNNRRRGHI